MNHRLRRRIIILGSISIGGLTLLAGAFVGRAWYREYKRQVWREEGLAAFAAKDYEGALGPLSSIVASEEDPEVRLAFAEARMKIPQTGLRHLKMAARVFSLVEATDPSNVRALSGRLECVSGLGYLAETRTLAERILALDSNNLKARESLMQADIAQGRWQTAITEARTLQELQPKDVRWRAAEVLCLSASGADSEEILRLVRGWLADAPDQIPIRILEADIVARTGNRAGAAEILTTIAKDGVKDVSVLRALISTLEALGLSETIDLAIDSSKPALGAVPEFAQIDSERLIRAGRIADLKDRYGTVDPSTVEGFRIRFAIEYLSANLQASYKLLESRTATNDDRAEPLLAAARAAFSKGGTRRLDRVSDAVRESRLDPLVGIILAESLVGAGDTEGGLVVLTQIFDQTGRINQPVGIRAVRSASTLGRIPMALEMARDLGLAYPNDPIVGMAILEAWAKALEYSYRPAFSFGVIARDDAAAFKGFWERLGRPTHLAPGVSQVLAKRGEKEDAKKILEDIGLKSDSLRLVLDFLPAAAAIDAETQSRLLEHAISLKPTGSNAIMIADRLQSEGKDERCAQVLSDAAERAASPIDRMRIERWRRALAMRDGESWEWLKDELVADPAPETAEFVLSRWELWNSEAEARQRYLPVIDSAIEVLRASMGESAQRVILAQAARDMVFADGDQATLARIAATLAAFEKQWPESVGGRILYARVLEMLAPPDFVRASAVLARAAELEPGRVELYPDLARVLQRTGDFSGASLAIESYARLAGSDADAARTAAQMRESIGQFSEAAAIRSTITERSRSLIDRLAAIQSKSRGGQLDEAEADLRQLLTELPDAYVGRELATLCARRGRLAEARDVLVALEPKIPGMPIDTLLAELELGFGSSDAALRFAEQAVEKQPGNPSDLILARVLLRRGEIGKARVPLLRAIERSPEDPTILPVASSILVADSSNESKRSLQKVIDSGGAALPELVEAVKLVSLVAENSQSGFLRPTSEQLRAARELTVRFANSPLIYNIAAQLHYLSGEKEEGARIALLGHSRLPLNEGMAELAVAMCSGVGRTSDAAAALSVWRRIPGGDSARVDASEAKLELVRRNHARAATLLAPHVERAIANQATMEEIEVYVYALVLSGRLNDLDRMIERVSPAMRLEVVTSALAATVAVPFEEALPVIRICARRAGDDGAIIAPISVYAIALCREGVPGACEDATKLVERLKAIAGSAPNLLEAELIAARGETSRAEQMYRQMIVAVVGPIGLDPTALAGKIRSDASVREKILSQHEVVPAMHNLAAANLGEGRDVPTSLGYARLLHELFPDSTAMSESLVKALIASNRLDEAREIAGACADPMIRNLLVAEIALKSGDLVVCKQACVSVSSVAATLLVLPRALQDRLDELEAEVEKRLKSSEQAQVEGT